MKRFYTDVDVQREPGGFSVTLDGRPIKTPHGRVVVLPGPSLAEAIADEWREQGEQINPRAMPLTRLVNTVEDGLRATRAEVVAGLTTYGKMDLICYWAEAPQNLVERQHATWQPLLDWVSEHLGAPVVATKGIGAVEQDERALTALEREIEAFDNFALAAIHEMTTLTGSVFLSLAVARGQLRSEAAWEAAHVDEAFQQEQWGEDAEAKARLEARRASFEQAVHALRLLGVVA